jgi:structural maintenance of chromosomes protein 5
MKREGNKSAFWINNKPSNKQKVSELCQKLSIQVDNLCQFLPQEKVSEFARMDPVFLLHETQRAVCQPEMLRWHENLKDLRKEQKKLQNEMKSNKETLQNTQRKQDLAATDVQRIQERDRVQKRVKLLEKCRPVAKYKEALERSKTLKEKRNAAKAECEALKKSVEPALRAVNAKQRYRQEVEIDLAKRKKKLEKVERDATSEKNEISAFDDKTQELEHEGEGEKNKQKTRKEEERRVHGNINRLKEQLRNEPAEFDAASYNEKLVSIPSEDFLLDTKTRTAPEGKNASRFEGSKP